MKGRKEREVKERKREDVCRIHRVTHTNLSFYLFTYLKRNENVE